MPGTTLQQRALADERRAQLVEELRSERSGLDAQELARRLGLHQNTVRWHLGILADARIVTSRPAGRTAPGRPRILYSLTGEAVDQGVDEHRLLATILTGALSRLGDGPAHAEEAGRAWGRYLVTRPEPLTEKSEGTAVAEVTGLLEQQGFAPTARGREIHMRRCPFHDLAESNPEVVCPVHRGLISGALGELGSDLEVDDLEIFAQPDLCIAHLRPRSGS